MNNKISKLKIALVCGGPSSEHKISLKSTQAILKNIDNNKYQIFIFYITKNLTTCFFKSKTKKLIIPKDKKLYLPLLKGISQNLTKVDLALLMGIHGEFVEDGRLQSLLELFNIKYTGSKVEASILAMDKYFSNLLVNNNLKIKIPKTKLIDLENPNLNFKITYPVILKPNNAGSSIGIYIINSYKELKSALKEISNSKFKYYLIQKYLKNSLEISCGCLEDKNGNFIKLPPIEIIPKDKKFFDYQAKYSKSGSIEITPPVSLNYKLSNKISDLACKIHQLLRCSSYSRSDFLIHNNEVYYLETNTLPGMTATSLLPKEARVKGIDFSQLIDFIIQNEF